ncbi:N-ethylmaleimide reductase [Penicillium atrosanguineum]|uniref:N-ethylmaleimide reductase n=1 Tax=Penicillium atrosanguineum TaxID=1132637 RepID=A0A9W9PQQ7_9EURO|nr:N-ethylmaleimide reductase [Penicillium atrosanguineum]KAJ5303188.1 N-ethylmaleimide reductase [Penicillium atrosanguineum]
MAEHNQPSLDGPFHFVAVHSLDDRKAKRLARSHAVARGLENKRKLQQKSGLNFHAVHSGDDPGLPPTKTIQDQTLAIPSFPIPEGELGPFQMLAAESPRLQALLSCHKLHHGTEPVLSVSDELVLQDFRSILRKGLDDHALLNAIMLTFASINTAGSIDRECLQYKVEVLSSIRQRMTSSDKATTESTLGAILLLAGIEARLGMPRQVQLHMGAIRQLLDICRRKSVYLSDGIKRAIFWSDLNASVMTGSTRVVDHTTFSELQWKRDPFAPSFFTLPPGFRPQSHLLGEDFVEVLKDVFALQCIRDSAFFGQEDVITMTHIDNHQASIQSRLSHLSLQLLCKVQQTSDDLVWNDWPDLLAWLLHIGGAFAPEGAIRSGYVELLQSNHRSRLQDLYTSWSELLEILKQFIWSEKAFMSQVKAFWDESLV